MNTELMFSSETDEWATPQAFFDELDAEFHFDLDVCALPENAKCRRYYSPEDDGLSRTWRGVCWMNPPYGREIFAWVKKAFLQSIGGATVVCLVPARTDTSWWHKYCIRGEIRFVKGRLKFGGQDNSAPFPSAVVIFRPPKQKYFPLEFNPSLKGSLLEMISISGIVSVFTRVVGRTGLILSKHAPTILTIVGVGGLTAAGVLACKATLKLEEKVDEIQEAHCELENAVTSYKNEKDYNKAMYALKFNSAKTLVKLYGPAVTLGVVSVACIFGAHNMMLGRNAAIGMLLKATEGAFSDYRKRLIADAGEAKDRQYRYGITQEMTTEQVTDEKGKTKNVKKSIDIVDPNGASVYARFFDDSNVNWARTPEYNLFFLKSKQNYCNDKLRARGHMFLNEVYEELGLMHSQSGAVVGWVISKTGDNFIDFGIYELLNRSSRDFVNGYEATILLDFNVDGVIFDKI